MTGQILPAAGLLPSSNLPPDRIAKLWQTAKDFEAMALGQLLAPMFNTIDTSHAAFGGGAAEAMWRPMMVDAIANQMATHGGIGLATPIFTAMLHVQEQSP
jgi:Rod binding domain-containing protein